LAILDNYRTTAGALATSGGLLFLGGPCNDSKSQGAFDLSFTDSKNFTAFSTASGIEMHAFRGPSRIDDSAVMQLAL